MIRLEDLETSVGDAEFAACAKSALNFIRGNGVFEDAEDLSQIVYLRVTEKLRGGKIEWVDEGYFINTAKYVLMEYWRKRGFEYNFFTQPPLDEETGAEQPIDIETQLFDFEDKNTRAISNECLVECFESLSQTQQILLWRYSFDGDKFEIETEEDKDNPTSNNPFLDSLKNIFQLFNPFKDKYPPMSSEEKALERGNIFRIRKGLQNCWKNCISRKKGF